MNQEQALQTAELAAGGHNAPYISSVLGIPSSTVSHNIKNNSIIRQVIESIHQSLVRKFTAIAAFNYGRLITEYNNPLDTSIPLPAQLQRREHGFRASQALLQAVGILPSHAPSILIQQQFNQTNVLEVSPAISQALEGLTSFPADPIEDAEVIG